MNDNPLLNKTITVSAKEEKLQGGKPVMKIKDQNNLTYTVYKTKQDGTTSVAWTQLADLNLGDNVQIGYAEQQGEYEGKAVTYRTIRSFNKDIGQGMANAQAQGKTTPQGHNNESDRESSKDFGKRLAIHGMVNGMLASGMTPEGVESALPSLLKLEESIDKALNPATGWDKARETFGTPEELPTLQQEEEIDVSDIPF